MVLPGVALVWAATRVADRGQAARAGAP
jgi:hypothetical protein